MNIKKKDKDYDSFLIKLIRNTIKKSLSIEKKLVRRKENGTELTLADIMLNEMICSSLNKLDESIPIISEENSFVPQQTTNLINNSMARVKRPQRNPLRHYRRQLTIDTVDTNTHNVSKYIPNDFNLPGKAIVVDNKDSCYDCLDNNNTAFFKQEIYPNNETFNQGTRYYDVSNNLSKCIACI